ncbi:hypothetical protein JYP46_08780 [Nitratireductor aquimarinus]|uniref:hypothetical protein n=1 Tax=Alphaproteobacteria TaxID=28211 RepID=UPI0019D3B6A0|nr:MULTISPECIES: hypothetical protein [Alphaproteobacteria]MBN7756907.1 hypothetical protein [Nitratireductor aquimarinus]MBY5999476.1 hypothetical protein [Tritonibacter mobilis]MBY6021502.1 hypothetical protein [Nitratireductor sp. DP7N14-4]
MRSSLKSLSPGWLDVALSETMDRFDESRTGQGGGRLARRGSRLALIEPARR